jgi:dolichol-phosphate mannosyltransferase
MTGNFLDRSHPRRAAAFTAIGIVNTAIDFSVFAGLYQLAGFDVVAANLCAFLLAAGNSYVLNRRITFADRRRRRARADGFARFLAVGVFALGASTAIVYLLSLHIHPLVAKLIATAASTLIGYAGSYWFVFPGDDRAPRPPLASK